MPRPPLGRQQLLDSARAVLVANSGVLELSALTRHTKLSTGALYHHFGSKAGLLEAIYDGFYADLGAAIADAHLPDDATWAVRERERTRRFVEFHFTDPLAGLVLDRAAPDPALAELDALHIANLCHDATINIKRGQRDGDISSEVDAPSAGAFLIGGLRHGIAQQLRLTRRPTVARATDRLWTLVASSLGLPI